MYCVHCNIVLKNMYSSKTDILTQSMYVQMRMVISVCTYVIVLKTMFVKYPSVFRTIYRQEGNEKMPFYNDRQLE